jgi:hypothetical protein
VQLAPLFFLASCNFLKKLYLSSFISFQNALFLRNVQFAIFFQNELHFSKKMCISNQFSVTSCTFLKNVILWLIFRTSCIFLKKYATPTVFSLPTGFRNELRFSQQLVPPTSFCYELHFFPWHMQLRITKRAQDMRNSNRFFPLPLALFIKNVQLAINRNELHFSQETCNLGWLSVTSCTFIKNCVTPTCFPNKLHFSQEMCNSD